MDKEKLIRILDRLTADKEFRDKWIEFIPSEISQSFWDNSLVNSLYGTQDFLLKEALGDELYDWVDWFIHEWRVGFTIKTQTANYVITGKDAFIEFLAAENLIK